MVNIDIMQSIPHSRGAHIEATSMDNVDKDLFVIFYKFKRGNHNIAPREFL
jgi:hypothetical protein